MAISWKALQFGLALVGSQFAVPTYAEEPTRLLQILTDTEFMQLPETMQSVFVGGVLEGMAFTAYGMSLPDYPKWVVCVRSKTLGGTTEDVIAFIKSEPDFTEGVASAVARTLGKRCKKT